MESRNQIVFGPFRIDVADERRASFGAARVALFSQAGRGEGTDRLIRNLRANFRSPGKK